MTTTNKEKNELSYDELLLQAKQEKKHDITCPSCGREWTAPTSLLKSLKRENIIKETSDGLIGQDYHCRSAEILNKNPDDYFMKKVKLPKDCNLYSTPSIVRIRPKRRKY